MWFFFGLFVLYCLATWHSLRQAASPMIPCRKDESGCFQPFVFTGDILSLQLELYQLTDSILSSSNSYHTWFPIESCQLYFSLPERGALPKLLTNTTVYNCTIPIPVDARRRSTDKDFTEAKPLKARFVFRFKDEVVTVAHFELTRVVEKRPSAFWSAGVATPFSSQRARNLLEEPDQEATEALSFKETIDSQPTTMRIPYFKYRQSPIRIRFVAEERGYSTKLQRADGVRLRAYNATHYAPSIYVDDLSLQRRAQAELAPPEKARDMPAVQLQIKISSIAPILDSLNQQMHQGFAFVESILPDGETELDEIRFFLSDERLYRFLLTQLISYLHMWLDYMAFRDEIRFYRGRQNLSGVSTSSVITRLVCSCIIFLYLLDGGGTSWVVLLSMGSSCAVEAWKVWKLLRPRWTARFPFVAIRELRAGKEQETAEYDRIAFRWLAITLYPVVIAWSLYTLKQYEYKSWYSWFISNLANAVYTFGFISMCPQLYINYRLKSVAHLPWKVFLYKIFNTFVDDAFAFLIEMPWKHRIMTLRDDVVFLIFLVQVYLYRVDKTRTNEFGYSYEDKNGGEESAIPKEHHHLTNDDNSDKVSFKVKEE